MSRAVIKTQGNQVEFDGREWRGVSGWGAKGLARILNAATPKFRRASRDYSDQTYGVAVAATKMVGGKIVEYEPNPRDPDAPPDRIY